MGPDDLKGGERYSHAVVRMLHSSIIARESYIMATSDRGSSPGMLLLPASRQPWPGYMVGPTKVFDMHDTQ